MEKKKNLFDKIKSLCSITVKNEGRALTVIFVLCLICIIALGVFIYRSSTNFYNRLDDTMQSNMNLNLEAAKNEHMNYVQDILHNKLHE